MNPLDDQATGFQLPPATPQMTTQLQKNSTTWMNLASDLSYEKTR